MRRAILVHRWSGGPDDDWRPWLRSELEKFDFEVLVPEMPDTETPVIEKWVRHLNNIVDTPDADTYFVGHSIGCQAILRYLEIINTSVGGAVFVSGWFDLQNLEDDKVKKIAEPWIVTPIDLEKVKRVLPQSALIISDNDPYDCFEENVEKFKGVGSKIIVLSSAGHITEEDGYRELPEVLTELKRMGA